MQPSGYSEGHGLTKCHLLWLAAVASRLMTSGLPGAQGQSRKWAGRATAAYIPQPSGAWHKHLFIVIVHQVAFCSGGSMGTCAPCTQPHLTLLSTVPPVDSASSISPPMQSVWLCNCLSAPLHPSLCPLLSVCCPVQYPSLSLQYRFIHRLPTILSLGLEGNLRG